MKAAPLTLRAAPLYLLVSLSAVRLHELGHALTSFALGGHPVMHATSVSSVDELSPGMVAVVQAAGPLASLVLGLIGFALYRATRRAGPEFRFAALWLTVDGFIGSLGYLILTPFPHGGDLGGIAEYLEVPMIVRWGIFGAGIFAARKLAPLLARPLLELAPSDETIATPAGRTRYLIEIALVPWIASLVIDLATDFPPTSIFSVLATIMMGIPVIQMPWEGRKITGTVRTTARPWGQGVPWVALLALVAMILVIVLVLRPGVRF